MKFICSLLLLISLAYGCKQSEKIEPESILTAAKKTSFETRDFQLTTNNLELEVNRYIPKASITPNLDQLNNDVSFEYLAISRGLYNKTVITKGQVSFQGSPEGKVQVKTCSEKNWEKLMRELKAINLKHISELKAPTEARFYDGAATALLKIKTNDVTYESQSFDHGTPPEAIENLVKQILSLTKNVE